MAGSVNKVILIGNLGRDPEVRNTPSGMKIVHLSLATSESWKDRTTGERQERTEWHRVVVMNENLAEIAERYLRKGSKVYVQGSLQTRKWTDQSGQERYTTEVILGRVGAEMVLLDSRPSGEGADSPPRTEREPPPARTGRGAQGWDTPKAPDLDDDIPF